MTILNMMGNLILRNGLLFSPPLINEPFAQVGEKIKIQLTWTANQPLKVKGTMWKSFLFG